MTEENIRLNALIQALTDQREAAYNLLARTIADKHVIDSNLEIHKKLLETASEDISKLQLKLEEFSKTNINVSSVEDLNAQIQQLTDELKIEQEKAVGLSIINKNLEIQVEELQVELSSSLSQDGSSTVTELSSLDKPRKANSR